MNINKQTKNSIAFLVAKILGIALQLLTLPILSAGLGAEGIGAIAYSQAIITVLGSVIDLGFNITTTKSISLARTNIEAIGRIFLSVQLFRLIVGVFCVVFIAVLSYFESSLLSNTVLLSSLALIGMMLTPSWYFQGTEKIPFFVSSTLFPRVLVAIALYILIENKPSIELAALIIFSGEMLIGVIQTFFVLREVKIENMRFSRRVLLDEVMPAFTSWTATIIPAIVVAGIPIYIKNKYGTTELGYFAAADKIMRAAHSFVWPVAQAFYPSVCRQWQLQQRVTSNTIFRTSVLLAVYGFLVFLIIYIFSENIVNILYGSEFSKSIHILKIILPFVIFSSMSTALMYFYLYPNSLYSIARTVALLSALFIFVFFAISGIWSDMHFTLNGIWMSEFLTVLLLGFVSFKKFYVWKNNEK